MGGFEKEMEGRGLGFEGKRRGADWREGRGDK